MRDPSNIRRTELGAPVAIVPGESSTDQGTREPALDRDRHARSDADAHPRSELHARRGDHARPASRRIRGVDGLRALAATSILVYHVWLYGSPTGSPPNVGLFNRFVAPHLPVGVTLFFTLSGFLLYRPIAAAVMHHAALPDARSYFRNRALRILPAYWVVLLATAVLLPAVDVRTSATRVALGRLVSHPAQLLANGLFMQNYFRGSMDSGIGPTWSLAVEVVFYISLPLLGLLALAVAGRSARVRRRTLAVVVPAAVLYGLGVGTSVLTDHMDRATALYAVLVRTFLYHADLFAFGMLLAVLATHVMDGSLVLPRRWAFATGAAFVALVGATMIMADRGVVLTFQGDVPYETLTALAAALLLALVVLPRADGSVPWLTRLLDSRALVAVGLVSYSLFLWHEPLIRWFNRMGWTFAGGGGFVANLALFAALTGVLSALTYRYIERPALARKRRSRTQAVVVADTTADGAESPAALDAKTR
jgi:peptidoglycan/LPS O-acetylase OafA/YrhL